MTKENESTSGEGEREETFSFFDEPSESEADAERDQDEGEDQEEESASGEEEEEVVEPDPLFGSDEDDEDDDDEKEGDGKLEPFHKHPRFKKLRESRDEWKDRALTAETSIKDMEEKPEPDAALGHYSDFEDPVAASVEDREMMDLFQRFKGVPDVRKALDFVMHYKQTGEAKPTMPERTTPQKAESEKPATDKRVEILLRDRTERMTEQVLAQVNAKPAMKKVLAKAVLDRIDPSTDVGEEDIVTVLRQYIRETGLTSELVTEQKAGKRDAPSTGSRGSGVAVSRSSQRKKEGPGGDGKPTDPETAAEAADARSSRFASLVDEELSKGA